MSQNISCISGTVVTEPVYQYSHKDVVYYRFKLSSLRSSLKEDLVDVLISDDKMPGLNDTIMVYGRLKTRRTKNSTALFLFSEKWETRDFMKTIENKSDTNCSTVLGVMCSASKMVKKNGKTKSFFVLAVTSNKKLETAYVRCSAWEDNAVEISKTKPGDFVMVTGTLQTCKGYVIDGIKITQNELSATAIGIFKRKEELHCQRSYDKK